MTMNSNQPNIRLGQTETMTRNNQDERQERLSRLLKNVKNKNTIKEKETDIIEFTEKYLGIKLEEYQKELIKSIYNNRNKNWHTLGFSPSHSFSYSYNTLMCQILKEILREKEN